MPARSFIPGTELTDFIDLGKATPFYCLNDMLYALIMVSLVLFSIIKLGILISGNIFLTVDGFPEW